MAELSMPSLKFEITADGSAAIEELEKVEEAVNGVKPTREWNDVFKPVGDSAKEAGKEADKLGKAGESAGKQISDGARKASVSLKDVGEKMSSIGKGMTAAVTVPIVGALAASVKGASDMTETLGKTDVVFGDMTDRVLDWSNNSVEAMGLAQQTALDMAATYGDMATGMGLSQNKAAEMSTALVQLGADMASFKNIGIDEVNSAMTAVFTGETESLKRLGIVMTQTNLQQYALSQGITTQIEKMSQAEQVQLRYNYVLAMTKNAQGDFQRTGGNLANQTRALGETIKQAANSFGALLVPEVTKVASALRDGAQGLAEMDDGTKRIVISIGMAVAAAGPLLLVGGKALTLITSIRTSLSALSINPVTLGIAGAAASIAALVGALKALEPEVDTGSESYQSLKSSIEEGASGKVSLDTSEIPESVEVSITANGEQALREAKDIIETLDTDPQFDGKLAIDGDPDKAEQVIAQVKADILAVEEAVKIGGNDEAAREAIEKLEADISTLEGAVVIAEDPEAKKALNEALTALRGQLAALKGSVTISTEGEDGLDSLKKKLEEYDGNTYSATGEFVVSSATAEAVKEYAEAVAAAASATGNYKEAVESLNGIVDQDTQRKIGEVNAQLAETGRYYTAQLNDGAITQEQYDSAISKAVSDANQQIETIEKQAEAQKKLNEAFADGTRANDASTFGRIMQQTYAEEHLTPDEGKQSLKRVVNGEVEGEQAQIDAGTALNGMIAEQTERRLQLAQAVQEYNSAMAEADNLQKNGAKTEDGMSVQEAMERAQIERDALEKYSMAVREGGNPEQVMEGVVNHFSEQLSAYEGLEDSLRNLLSGGENGEGLSYADSLTKGAELDALIGGYQEQIDGAVDEAQSKREEALATLQSTLSDLGQGYTEAETQAAMSAIESAGVPIDEATQALLTSAPNLIDELSDAIESGDSSQIQSAVENALAGVDLTTVGQSIPQGVAAGMSDTSEISAAGQAEADAAYNSVHDAVQMGSPAARMIPVGQSVAQGVAEGMKDTSSIQAGAAAVAQAIQAALDAALSGESGEGGEQGAGLGGSIMDGVAQGANAATGTLTSAIASVVSSAINSARGRATSQGRGIGTSLMAGIRSGIASAASSVASSARSAVQQAVSAAKQAAEIHSPSGVMREEVGVMLMRGMEAGVEDRAPTTLQIIQESMRGLISGATKVVNQNGIPAPAMTIPAPSGPAIDYELLAEANARRPVVLNMSGKQLAQATRDEAARQQAVRVAQINAGYGGR